MTAPPIRADAKPTAIELAEAAAYLDYRECPNAETDARWRRAWFAATGGLPIWAETRCKNCGMHRSYLLPSDPCRSCGRTNERRMGPCNAQPGVREVMV